MSGLVQQRFDESARVILLRLAPIGDAQPDISDRSNLLRLCVMIVNTHGVSLISEEFPARYVI